MTKTTNRGEGKGQTEGKEEAPVLQTEAKGEGGKGPRHYVNAFDFSVSPEDFQRLSLQVSAVEREHGRFLRVWLLPYATQQLAMGRRFSVGAFCDRKSWQGIDAPDHNAQPVVARLLCEELPQVRPLVELRRSKWDAVFARREASRGA